MLDFKPLTPADVPQIQPYIKHTPDVSCEFSPACLMMWGHAQIAPCGDFLVPLVTYGTTSGYLRPLGGGDFREILPQLEEDARERGMPFRLYGLTPNTRAQMEELGRYRFETCRDYYDYVYSVESLATLAGGKLQPKRNHINRFLTEHDDWHCEPISAENIDECRTMCEEWYAEHAEMGVDLSHFAGERFAISFAFDNYDAIGFEGLALRADGRIIAFTMGTFFSADTYDVNFEKAFSSIQGAYALINREFSRHVHETHPDVRFLNREDDMGLPGLRKAKLSYQPAVILEKYTAVLAEDTL